MNIGVTDKHLIVVLEPGNAQKLSEGKPILIRVSEFYPDGVPKNLEILITYNENPSAVFKDMSAISESSFNERASVIQNKQPHCTSCNSTIEQVGISSSNESPFVLVFCSVCMGVINVLLKPGESFESLKQLSNKTDAQASS